MEDKRKRFRDFVNNGSPTTSKKTVKPVIVTAKDRENAKNYYDDLNDGQRKAFDAVMSGRNVFITGSGGVGKSFLLKAIIAQMKVNRKRVVTLASTGQACSNLITSGIKALTIHSYFKNGTGIWYHKGKRGDFINNGRKLTNKKIDAIIIDEVSMCRVYNGLIN